MTFNLQTLTEGIRERHVGTQNKRLVEKWSRTGLLRGMDDVHRENMATLLENQAAQLLREANTLGSGTAGNSDIRGFANVAFPIVRRVFGGLVANELVSIQPMSLPSGLLFYLDYTYGDSANGGDGTNSQVYESGKSIYNRPTGKEVQSGSLATGGQYDLAGTGFSKNHQVSALLSEGSFILEQGSHGADNVWTGTGTNISTSSDKDLKLVQFDSQIIDLIDAGEKFSFVVLDLKASDNLVTNPNLTMVKDLAIVATSAVPGSTASNAKLLTESVQGGKGIVNVRRLNQLGVWDDTAKTWTANPLVTLSSTSCHLLCVVNKQTATAGGSEGADANLEAGTIAALKLNYVLADQFEASETGGDTLTVPSFESNFGNPPTPVIPEIDIKIESLPVTAQTRKLRARWSPELAQDLNAYHSMDAEVELTQILSEQIALEIDREILNDLLTQAQGANFFWSRAPGKFVNKKTGAEIARASTLNPGPAFTGTVREWYETLSETVIDVANEIHRKTLRGSANFIVVSPDVATILEASVLYRPSYSLDGDGQVGTPFTMGAEKMGTLSNRFTVYKDPYFPRNKILVGYKGGSYLETGFVYAPYVPLIVTPTIFQPDDFTPRKGVMTRYGKKMVRADFYGTVTCLDMNII